MIDQLEDPVREALRRHASQIPDAATARLRSVEYHPRSARWPTPVGVGAGAGAAATAATVLLLGGSQPAFAGWSATPTTASSSQVSAAEAACEAQLAAPPPAGSRPAIEPSTAAGQGMAPVLTDVRGPYTVTIYADGSSSSMTCFTGPSFTVVSNRSSNGQGTSVGGSVSVGGAGGGIASAGKGSGTSFSEGKSVAVGTAPADQLQVYGAHLTLPNGSAYTLIEGQAGSDVTGATLVLDNGQKVEARTEGGWFEAWWPGAATAVTAEVSTGGGTVTEQLPPWTMPPPPTNGVSGAGSSSGA